MTDTPGASMASIEHLARAYADAHAELAQQVRALEDEIAEVKRRRLPMIRRRIEAAADWKADLVEAVDAAPDLFRRPKTRILHGVRVGFAKGKGKVKFASAKAVVDAIRRKLPAQFDALVKVTETPVKKALAALPGADLKRIGVTVEETGDAIVVQATDSEIDKLVDALLADHEGAAE